MDLWSRSKCTKELSRGWLLLLHLILMHYYCCAFSSLRNQVPGIQNTLLRAEGHPRCGTGCRRPLGALAHKGAHGGLSQPETQGSANSPGQGWEEQNNGLGPADAF